MREKPSNDWLSIGAYARTYGLSRQTVYKWLEGGHLESYRKLGVTRIKNIPPDQHQQPPTPIQ